MDDNFGIRHKLFEEAFIGIVVPSGPCIVNFQRPPSVNSKISKVLEKPSGPHHKANKSATQKRDIFLWVVYGKFLEVRIVLSALITVTPR